MAFTNDQITFTESGFQIKILFRTKQVEDAMKELKEKCKPHLNQMADDVKADAEAHAPRLTPPNDMVVLKESLTAKLFGPRAKSLGFRVRTNTRLFNSKEAHAYGAHVEFGTSTSRAVPFLYPAADKVFRNAATYLTSVL